MALPDLEDHFATHGVDPGLSSQLIQSGWTSQNFSVIVDSLAGFTDEALVGVIRNSFTIGSAFKLEISVATFTTGGCATGA